MAHVKVYRFTYAYSRVNQPTLTKKFQISNVFYNQSGWWDFWGLKDTYYLERKGVIGGLKTSVFRLVLGQFKPLIPIKNIQLLPYLETLRESITDLLHFPLETLPLELSQKIAFQFSCASEEIKKIVAEVERVN